MTTDVATVEDAEMSIVVEMEKVLAQAPETILLFKTELERLLSSLVKSQESEQRLLQCTKEVLAEIQSSHETMLRDKEKENEALEENQKVRLELDAIVQKIASTGQTAMEKQQKVNGLKIKLETLQEEVSKIAKSSEDAFSNVDQELQIVTLKKKREEYARDVDAKTLSLQNLRKETSNLFSLLQDEEAKNTRLEETRANIVLQIQEKQSATERETRRKIKLEKELKVLKQTHERLQTENAVIEIMKKENEENLRKKELALRGSKQKMENYIKQYDGLFRTTHSLTEAMQLQWQKNVELHKENVQVENELDVKEQQILTIARDTMKTESLMEIARDQLQDVQAKRSDYESEKETVKLELGNLVGISLEAEEKQRELLTRKIEEMLQEREVLNKMLVKSNDQMQASFDLLKIKENTMKNLQNEISGHKSHVKKQRAKIQQYIEAREKNEKQAAHATQKFKLSLEEAKAQDIQVVHLQQKIVESENRLKTQQNLYEAVRSDRNLYSKQLIETQEEIGELRQLFKAINHQIEQLKETITSKDHALVKEHFDHHKVDKEKENLNNELLRIKKQIYSSEQIIMNQEQEVIKLAKIVQEADGEKQRQLKEYGRIIHDRDVLRQQLVLRNEELAKLYEKIKIQKSTLSKGFQQYQEKVLEVGDLQSRIHSLTLERDLSSNQLSHEGSLKQELVRLEKELLKEKARIRALSEELDHPLNVHRWRKLEGSDPQRFELIQKLQAIQRRLIHKHEETTVKDLLILEKEKLYVELKTVLARQPGAEVAEQLAVYKKTLQEKHNQMKQMEDELQMYKLQVSEYRSNLNQLEKDKKQIENEWIDRQSKSISLGDDQYFTTEC